MFDLHPVGGEIRELLEHDRLRRVTLITVVINGVLAVSHVLSRGHVGALDTVHVNELLPDGSLLTRAADVRFSQASTKRT